MAALEAPGMWAGNAEDESVAARTRRAAPPRQFQAGFSSTSERRLRPREALRRYSPEGLMVAVAIAKELSRADA